MVGKLTLGKDTHLDRRRKYAAYESELEEKTKSHGKIGQSQDNQAYTSISIDE